VHVISLTSHTHPFNGPFSGTTQVSRYQKGKTNLDFTEARDSEWQWHQLQHMQVCTSLQTDNHANTHHSVFLQTGCPSCRPTNSVKALNHHYNTIPVTPCSIEHFLKCILTVILRLYSRSQKQQENCCILNVLDDSVSIQLLYRNALDIHCRHTASQLHVAERVV